MALPHARCGHLYPSFYYKYRNVKHLLQDDSETSALYSDNYDTQDILNLIHQEPCLKELFRRKCLPASRRPQMRRTKRTPVQPTAVCQQPTCYNYQNPRKKMNPSAHLLHHCLAQPVLYDQCVCNRDPCSCISENDTTTDMAAVDVTPISPKPNYIKFRKSRSSVLPTVRTPRYYRCPKMEKRPSKLCVPLACRPNAVHHHQKIPRQKLVCMHHCCPQEPHCPVVYKRKGPRKQVFGVLRVPASCSQERCIHHGPSKSSGINSKSEDVAAEIKQVSSDLDELMARYDRFEVIEPNQKRSTHSTNSFHSAGCPAAKNTNIPTYNVPLCQPPHMLKPKIPATVKERLERTQKHIRSESVEDIRAEILEELQQELAQSVAQQKNSSTADRSGQKNHTSEYSTLEEDYSALEEEYSDEPEARQENISCAGEKQREAEGREKGEVDSRYVGDETVSNFSNESREKLNQQEDNHYSRDVRETESVHTCKARSTYSREEREAGSSYSRENVSEHSHEVTGTRSKDGRVTAQDGREAASSYSHEEQGDYTFDARELASIYHSGDRRDDEISTSSTEQIFLGDNLDQNYNSGDQRSNVSVRSGYYLKKQNRVKSASKTRKAQGDGMKSSMSDMDTNSVLGGLLSDLLKRGYITSISEDQKHSLQNLYAKLQQDSQEGEESDRKIKSPSFSSLAKKSTATYHGMLYEPDEEVEASVREPVTSKTPLGPEEEKFLDSKDYIESLIDSAVSRELETISEEPVTDKRSNEHKIKNVNNTSQQSSDNKNDGIVVRMDVSQAIDLVDSESSCGINKDFCMEITKTLTDTLVTKKDKSSSVAMDNRVFVQAEEPAFLKQLKQLRWDHLKHIQREVQRLEDLEKFLDSCNSGISVCETSSSPT